MRIAPLASILAAAFMSLSLPLMADVQFSLADFEKVSAPRFSMISVGGATFGKLSLSPDFNLGPIGVGIDSNLYIPADSSAPYPAEFNSFVLRRVAYDHNKVAGFEYGRLQNVSYGYGLLMNNYDSGSGGATSEFSNEKAGAKGYVRLQDLTVNAMYTASQVKAARVTYETPVALMGVPVIAGATYVTDEDGLDKQVDGNQVSRKSQAGYALDVAYPLGGEFMTFYSEYAKLENYSAAGAVGVRGDLLGMFGYKAEYRTFGANFVPEYFNRTYEATSFDATTDMPGKRLSGFLVGAYGNVLGDYVRLGAEYEAYEDRNLLTAALGWQRIGNTAGVINYKVPFQTGGNPILSSDIAYYTGGPVDYVVHWKQVYIDANTKTESYAFSLRFNMAKMFPGLPF
jgi:hypothetical protein